MSYNAIAMVTDYDCWKDDTEAVDAQHVLKVIKGQIISEWLLDVFILNQKTNKNISVFLA